MFFRLVRAAAYVAMIGVVIFGAACVKTSGNDLERAQRRIDRANTVAHYGADFLASYLAAKSAAAADDPDEWQRSKRKVRDVVLAMRGVQTAEGAWVSIVNQRSGGNALSEDAVAELDRITRDGWNRLEGLVMGLDSDVVKDPYARVGLSLGMARARKRARTLKAKWLSLKHDPDAPALTWSPFGFSEWYEGLPSQYNMPPLQISAKTGINDALCEASYAVCLATGGSLVECYARLCECSSCERPDMGVK